MALTIKSKMFTLGIILCMTMVYFDGAFADDHSWRKDVESIEAITHALHRWASVKKGEVRDNRLLAYLVVPDAYAIDIIHDGDETSYRTSFIRDWLKREPVPASIGYHEKVKVIKYDSVGQFANVWADYEIREVEGAPAISLGVTNIQVYYDGMRWWILGWQNIKRKRMK